MSQFHPIIEYHNQIFSSIFWGFWQKSLIFSVFVHNVRLYSNSKLVQAFVYTLHQNNWYFLKYLIVEFSHILALVSVIHLTDLFLSGNFSLQGGIMDEGACNENKYKLSNPYIIATRSRRPFNLWFSLGQVWNNTGLRHQVEKICGLKNRILHIVVDL